VNLLRQIEVLWRTAAQACKEAEIVEQTCSTIFWPMFFIVAWLVTVYR
jgi:hypothetical protein